MGHLTLLTRAARRTAVIILKALVALVLATAIALIAVCQPWPSSAEPGGFLERASQHDLDLEKGADRRARTFAPPSPPIHVRPTGLWQLRAVRAQEAWAAIGHGAPRTRVGFFDGIIARGHPDLEPNILAETTDQWQDVAIPSLLLTGHGTAIMGITAGAGGRGMPGVAPRSHLLMAHTLGPDPSTMPDALRFFASNKARLANFAIALPTPLAAQRDVDEAYEQGALIVTGLYNADTDGAAYPAAHLRAITVSGVDENDRLMGYGWGPLVDVVAPATGILSTGPVLRAGPIIFGGRYVPLCCNSAATAIVTGVAALVLEHDPTLTSAQLEKRIKLAARKVPAMNGARWHPRYGYGVTDAYAAVTYDQTGPSITVAQFTALPDGMRGIGGIAKDNIDDQSLEPGRERDRHLAGVPISNIDRVEYHTGDGNWRNVAFIAAPDQERARAFSVQVPSSTPTVTFRAWDTAGNAGPEFVAALPTP